MAEVVISVAEDVVVFAAVLLLCRVCCREVVVFKKRFII